MAAVTSRASPGILGNRVALLFILALGYGISHASNLQYLSLFWVNGLLGAHISTLGEAGIQRK